MSIIDFKHIQYFLLTGVDGYVVFFFDDLGETRPFTLLIEAEVVGKTETITLTTVFRLRKFKTHIMTTLSLARDQYTMLVYYQTGL